MLEDGLDGSPQTIFMGEGFSNPAFQPPPALFNAIQVRGIRWEIKDLTACRCNQFGNSSTMVKGGIIEYDPVARAQFWNQTGLQPGFKDGTVTGSFNRKRRDKLMPPIPGDHVDSPTASPGFKVIAPLACRGIAVSIGIALIHSRLIDVDPMRRLGVRYLSYERLSLLLIALTVAIGLFFRVQLMTPKAREIVR